MHIHWNFGYPLYPVLLTKQWKLHQMHAGLDCSLLTSHWRVAALHPGRSVSPLAYLKINCAAFPDKMAGRHLHCFRTLRSMSVRCTSRGHNQHSPKGLQPANSLAGLSCTIRQLANHRHCLRGFDQKITPLIARITSPCRFYGDSYFKEQGQQGFQPAHFMRTIFLSSWYSPAFIRYK
jgi:hypothetical protein